jgi:glycosyltransferase involved in cell wall biosynthesis
MEVTLTVRLVQSALPVYRAAFLGELARRVPGGVDVLVGGTLFEATVRTAEPVPVPATRVRNLYLGGRRLLWQRRVLFPGVKADVAILELNPRILTVWAIVFARRALRRPTILWGHAWPRRGQHAPTDRLRSLLRRQASVLVTYTETQADELRAALPGRRVLAAPNALYPSTEMRPLPVRRPLSFIFSGRLVSEKKPLLLVEAFGRVADQLGDTRLVVIGSGPEEAQVLRAAHELGIAHRLDLAGPVADLPGLRGQYAHAIASVAPGSVGLSIVQSLGFGIPMIASDAEPHGPEIEAAVPGVTAQFFVADSAASLAETLLTFHRRREEWLSRRVELAAWCRERYSVERSADRFTDAIRIAVDSTDASGGSGIAS